MRTLSRLAAFFCLSLVWTLTAPAFADDTIVLMRHGEKPADGRGQLNCTGLNRSLALPGVLLQRFGNPVAVYAPNPSVDKPDSGVDYAYVRPLATIEPTAVRAGLPVRVKWGYTDTVNLEADLVTQILPLAAEHRDATIFVAWEHKVLVDIAKHLLSVTDGDPTQVPAWDYSDFDTLYVIHFKANGKGGFSSTFEIQKQGLNNLPSTCPGAGVR